MRSDPGPGSPSPGSCSSSLKSGAPGHEEDAERGREEGDHPKERRNAEIERSWWAHQIDNPETAGHLVSERLHRDEPEQLAVPETLRDAKRWWGRRGGNHPGRTDRCPWTKRLRSEFRVSFDEASPWNWRRGGYDANEQWRSLASPALVALAPRTVSD